jgi:hypothetical protein
LDHIGIEAWPVLVLTRDYGSNLPLPAFSFDHLITACIINNDTVYVDPSGFGYDARHSLSVMSTGQPCLNVGGYDDETSKVNRLPLQVPDDYKWTSVMKLIPEDDGPFEFVYDNWFYNLSAGDRRYKLRGLVYPEIRKEIESSLAENWGVVTKIDTLAQDSVYLIDSIFNETIYGTISPKSQTIGKSRILNPPLWPLFAKGLLAYIGDKDSRRFDIDLKNFVGTTIKKFRMDVPGDYGLPQLPGDTVIQDSLLYFSLTSDWNQEAGQINMDYTLKIYDGRCDVDRFAEFANKVIEIFDTPILFQGE